MDSPVYNCKHRSRLEDISTSSSLDRSDINMMDLFETQPARNVNRNNNAAMKTDTADKPNTSIFTSASTSAQKPPETSGFFISAKSNSRIQVASNKANILNDIFGDLDNDTLAANLISSKIKPKSGNSRPKFNSSSFQKPRTIQATIPASKPVPNISKNTNSVKSASNPSQHDSRINDSNDFSDEFDDDFAFITPTTISTNSTIATNDIENPEKIGNKYEHRALDTQKMNLVEKYSKYNKQETKSKEPEIRKPEDLPENNELNDSINSIDSDPPSPIITQTKHRIDISSESENDASQEKINPHAFIVKQEPEDDSFSNRHDGANLQPNPQPVGNFFSTASGSSVTISEEAKVKAAQGWSTNQENKQSAACNGFFSTASGSTVSIDDNALEKSKNLLRNSTDSARPIKSNGGPSSGFFSTAKGGQVTIDANALAKSKGLFESSTDTITPVKSSGGASSAFFSTGRGGQVNIYANALAKSKGIFDNSADFTTPSKSSLTSSGGFFATAKGGQVQINAETLAKSKSLFQSSSANAQAKALIGPKNAPSTNTPARPIRPYAGSMNLKRKSAFPETIADLEEIKKGRIEAEQQCIRAALRNSYSNFENFKTDEDDHLRTHQNELRKEIFDLIMPRTEFDMEEKARLNGKLFQPLLQSSNQKESIQEQN